MGSAALRIDFAGQALELLPERAVFAHGARALIVADLHVGRERSALAQGLARPLEPSASDLRRLHELMLRHGARELWVLGDFVHSRRGLDAELQRDLGAWLAEHRTVVVLGNHDRPALAALERLPLEIVPEPHERQGFWLAHDPDVAEARAVLCGHVHPRIALQQGREKLKLPCFVQEERRLILPAFGSLAGGLDQEAKPSRRIHAIAGTRVLTLP